MSAKALLKRHSLNSQVSLNNGYLVSQTGEEIKITKDMIKLACHQLLSRCKK